MNAHEFTNLIKDCDLYNFADWYNEFVVDPYGDFSTWTIKVIDGELLTIREGKVLTFATIEDFVKADDLEYMLERFNEYEIESIAFLK